MLQAKDNNEADGPPDQQVIPEAHSFTVRSTHRFPPSPGGTYAAAHLGSWMAGIEAPPAHPIDLIAGLAKGRVPWPSQSTLAGCLMAGVVIVLAVIVLVA